MVSGFANLCRGVFLCLSLILISSQVAAATSKPKPMAHSHAELATLLLATTSYCFKLHPVSPRFCHISADAGGCGVAVSRKLSRLGIRAVSSSWIASQARPARFAYVELDQLRWLSARRARIRVYLARGADPPRVTETYGVLYMELKNGTWKVDQNASLLDTGE